MKRYLFYHIDNSIEKGYKFSNIDEMDILRKENDKNIIKKNVINNVNLAKVDKIFNNYVGTNNKKIDIYYIYCEVKIQFDNNFITGLKANYVSNKENEKISQCLIFSIEYLESKS